VTLAKGTYDIFCGAVLLLIAAAALARPRRSSSA
jgi:hypothetical protein